MTNEQLLTRAELSRACHVNTRTIAKWEAAGMPVARRGTPGLASGYRLADVRAWLAARDGATAAQRKARQAARDRRDLAQALEAEQRVAMRAARLLAVEEVDRVWAAQCREIRRRLTAGVKPWTRAVMAAAPSGPAAVEEVLRRNVYAVLTQLSTGELPELDDQPAKQSKATKRRTSARGRS